VQTGPRQRRLCPRLLDSRSLRTRCEHAAGLYSALSNQPSTCVRVGPLIGRWGPVDHHLGSPCRLVGRLDDAERHLESALNLEERIGAWPFAARTLGVLSGVARDRSSTKESDRADKLMERALALADLESPGIAEEIRAEGVTMGYPTAGNARSQV
jgi:hypothetical protein